MLDDSSKRDPIRCSPPWIVGHRGVAEEAVENTLPSLELAVEQRADMIEFDVQLTADGQLVAFHDWDLTRLAHRPEVVEETAFSHLVEVFPALATLGQILESLPDTVPLNVELKCRNSDVEQFTRLLAETLGERPGILLSSFDWELLRASRVELPAIAMAPLADETTEGLLAVADELNAWAVNCHHPLATCELIDQAGRPILVYTVNEVELARSLFDSGVAGVFTDAPGRLRRQLGLDR